MVIGIAAGQRRQPPGVGRAMRHHHVANGAQKRRDGCDTTTTNLCALAACSLRMTDGPPGPRLVSDASWLDAVLLRELTRRGTLARHASQSLFYTNNPVIYLLAKADRRLAKRGSTHS
eukprot:scaffold97647_cov30-Tisochrysis_lutea.AAC.1